MLHSALAPLGQRQAQVLQEREKGRLRPWPLAAFNLAGVQPPSPPSPAPYLGYALEVEREHILAAPCLALPHQEHSVSIRTLELDQLSRLHPGDGTMEPGVAGQEVICFLAGWIQQRPRRSTW